MKIAMYDLEGHLLEVFDVKNVSQLAKKLKIPPSSLHKVLNGSNISTNGYQFKNILLEKEIRKNIGDVTYFSKYGNGGNIPIIKYYKGTVITVYKSLTEASEKNSIEIDRISKCLNNKAKTAGGFEWKYAE